MSASAQEEATRLIQATAWQIRFDAGDADEEAFAVWLTESENADAWARVSRPLDLIEANANQPKMIALRQVALSYAQRSRRRLNAPRLQWRRWVAAVAIAISLVSAVAYWLLRPDDYGTAFNERRIVTLPDGSKVSLDSSSEVTVHYTKTGRELRLLRGQARFDVAHDVERPFSVIAGDQKVVATGTAFNIDMTQPKVLVTLIEGHVVVLEQDRRNEEKPTSRQAAVELHAGQQLAAIPNQAPVIAAADIRTVTAWTGGQLIFDDQPLSEIVARVNHYTAKPIMIADARTAELHLSGSFNTGDVDGFVDIVTHYLPVQEVVADDGTVTLQEK